MRPVNETGKDRRRISPSPAGGGPGWGASNGKMT